MVDRVGSGMCMWLRHAACSPLLQRRGRWTRHVVAAWSIARAACQSRCVAVTPWCSSRREARDDVVAGGYVAASKPKLAQCSAMKMHRKAWACAMNCVWWTCSVWSNDRSGK